MTASRNHVADGKVAGLRVLAMPFVLNPARTALCALLAAAPACESDTAPPVDPTAAVQSMRLQIQSPPQGQRAEMFNGLAHDFDIRIARDGTFAAVHMGHPGCRGMKAFARGILRMPVVKDLMEGPGRARLPVAPFSVVCGCVDCSEERLVVNQESGTRAYVGSPSLQAAVNCADAPPAQGHVPAVVGDTAEKIKALFTKGQAPADSRAAVPESVVLVADTLEVLTAPGVSAPDAVEWPFPEISLAQVLKQTAYQLTTVDDALAARVWDFCLAGASLWPADAGCNRYGFIPVRAESGQALGLICLPRLSEP